MTDVKLKISPPWVTYANEVKAIFENDPEIHIEYDNDSCELLLYVDNARKATALTYLLPVEKVIGNVTLGVTIIPANGELEEIFFGSDKEIIEAAFEKNPIYSTSIEIKGLFAQTLTYVLFKNKVVQFFNDNLNDIHGIVSTLYEDLAREVFAESSLICTFFNTDIEEKLGMPLGEWP